MVANTPKPLPPRTVDNTALCFEGGGTRGAYTAGVVTMLIEEGIVFPWVGGISAGSSHTANYCSWDIWRNKVTFVDLVGHPNFMGMRHYLAGRGYFNAEWMYEHTSEADQVVPLDWATFRAFPAQSRIGAFCADDGRHVYFGREDSPRLDIFVRRVRASSTMPLLMPPVEMDGHVWVDGALGPTGGFPTDAADADGFERKVVVMTQERGYVKKPMKYERLLRRRFKEYPAVVDALMARPARYNATREELFDLERDGKVLIFAPNHMPIGNTERRVDVLASVYQQGLAQAREEASRFKDFLGL